MTERERYIVLRNNQIVAVGTASECAVATGLKPRTIQAYAADPRRVGIWRVKHAPKGI
jgi:hypothetical protein|nr:MAG TPA: putative excisionase [Caudoviricetes sp.]